MKNAMKKLLSAVLALVLVIGVCPAAFAAEAQTCKLTFAMKSSADGSNVGTHEFVAVVGDPVYVGFIVNGKYGYEVTGFAVNGTVFGPEDSIVAEKDAKIAVYVTVKEEPEVEEVTPPTEEKEPEKEPEKETQPVVEKKTLTVTIYEVDLNGNADEYKTVTLEAESFNLNRALAEKIYTANANFDFKWQGNVESGSVNLLVFPTTTEGNKKIITLKLAHNDGTSDYDTVTMLAGDEILDAIKDADISISRIGYYLAGWSFDMNCSKDIGRDDIATENMTIYAEWEKKSDAGDDYYDYDGEGDVLLRIYLNEYTRNPDKVVNMDAYDNDGKITYAEAAKVVKKYYKQANKNDDMDIEGLFTYKTWNSGDYDMDDAKNTIYVNDDGEDTIIYVMVRDAKKISSGTADSSNPKTGDTIFMAFTVMALSATALAAVYVFNKKRAVK